MVECGGQLPTQLDVRGSGVRLLQLDVGGGN